LNVLPATSDATIFHQAEGPASESTGLFSAVSALVGFLFAFNAMLLTVPQRRRLVSDLRLDGYTPAEIAIVLLCDALMLGVAGAIAGLLLGDWVSRHLLEASPGYLSLAFPVGSQRIVTWQCVVIAASGGLLAACVGVLNPLRAIFAGSLPPARERSSQSRLGILWVTVGGLVCLGVSTVILLAGVQTVQLAVLASVSLLAAMLLLLPALLGAIVFVVDRGQREVLDASRRLALIELQSSTVRVRSAAIAATGAVAVFGSVAIEGARHNLAAGLNRAAAEMALVTDLWITSAGTGSTLATAPFQANFDRMLSHLRGVRAVRVYRGSFLDIGDRRALVMAPPRTAIQPIPPHQIVQGNLVHASALLQGHGWATVSQALAGELHLHVGKRFMLPTSRPATFRLAAVTTNFGWSPGVIVVNADDYARAWGSSDPSAYQLELDPGVPPVAAQAEIRRALGPRSGLSVQTAAQRESIDRATQEQGLDRLRQIALLVLIAAVLAMATAMGAMIWQRRARLASMKVDGYDERELWRALLYESALLLGAGCSIGALFGLYGQLLLSRTLATVTGFPVVFSVAGASALTDVVLVAGVAFAIVAIPGYLAARAQPRLQCG
jgi:putative ABC transport system permease protein